MFNTCHQEIFAFLNYHILNLQYSVYEYTVCLKVTLYTFIPMHNCKHTCYVCFFLFFFFFFFRHVTSISQIPKSKLLLQSNRKKEQHHMSQCLLPKQLDYKVSTALGRENTSQTWSGTKRNSDTYASCIALGS